MAKNTLLAVTTALFIAGAAALPAQAKTTYSVKGRGYGHGIGMSQWGAYGFALHGWDYRRILAHYYTGTSIGKASKRKIRVLLKSGRSSVTLKGASAADGRSLNPDRKYRARAARGGKAVKLTTTTGRSIGVFSSPLRLTGRSRKMLFGQAINGVVDGRYRGSLEIRPKGSGHLNVINAVGLEGYVFGVVPAESPASWPGEALKTQAVAARSYAVATGVDGDGFDQYPDTRSQVYKGLEGEQLSTNLATRATKGEIVTYIGNPVATFFFSTSGGRTENIEWVFLGSSPQDFLKGVDDPYDSESPYHKWGPIRYTRETLGRKLGAKGRLRSVRVTKRGASPRIVSAKVKGSRGVRVLTGPQIRSRLGLRSTWIYIKRITTRKKQPSNPNDGGQPNDSNSSPGGGGTQASKASTTLTGSVHPVPRSRQVRVDRRQSKRWRSYARIRVDERGRYQLSVPAGTYRVVAGWAVGDTVHVK